MLTPGPMITLSSIMTSPLTWINEFSEMPTSFPISSFPPKSESTPVQSITELDLIVKLK